MRKIANGNFQKFITGNRAVYQPLVVGNKHGVGIVITTVKPLLNVIFNGVYADDIRREIEVGEDISLMRILCKIQIAHGDVRTAGAQHRFPVRESDRADLVFV